jgi:GMP synthase-like glutamine amidotransferase
MHIHFLQHVPFEGLGSMQDWFKKQNATLSATQLYSNPVFPDPDSLDWLVVMGGPMGANDYQEHRWLIKEKRFIEQVIIAQKKVIGICLGAQLLADVLGAKVYKHDDREIGWFPVTPVKGLTDHRLAKVLPAYTEVFHWHGDTFEIPEMAIHLFESKGCPNQGFLLGNNILGLQFHLEITRDGAKALIEACRDDMNPGPYVQSEQEILSRPERFVKINQQMAYVLDMFSSL